jgi:putative flippase GtrA
LIDRARYGGFVSVEIQRGGLSARVISGSSATAQALRFLVVGGASYVLNMSLYSLGLWLGLQYLVAAMVAYTIGFAFNFLANRHWTFDAADGALEAQFVRFTVLALVILGLDLLLLRFLVETLGVPKIPAQAVARLWHVPVSFAGTRLWSFAKSA